MAFWYVLADADATLWCGPSRADLATFVGARNVRRGHPAAIGEPRLLPDPWTFARTISGRPWS